MILVFYLVLGILMLDGLRLFLRVISFLTLGQLEIVNLNFGRILLVLFLGNRMQESQGLLNYEIHTKDKRFAYTLS